MITLLEGHGLDLLPTLKDASVQCCITSPPYFGLRDYGLPPQVWDEAPDCAHVWGEEQISTAHRQRNGLDGHLNRAKGLGKSDALVQTAYRQGAFCQRCQAWRGSLGLEPSPELYVSHLVQVMREVRRVLRDDGTLWLNLGDSYNSASGSGNQSGILRYQAHHAYAESQQHERIGRQPTASLGLKPKDLIGLPWRVAFALQQDGWYLRSDIIWHKSNPMPESVRDRPTRAHEYLFLLTKRATYYYDAEAIREAATCRPRPESSRWHGQAKHQHAGRHLGTTTSLGWNRPETGRNKRSVWTLATQPYPGAHFATFPPKLVEPCLLAGSSAHGCCAACGAPWVRVVSKTLVSDGKSARRGVHRDTCDRRETFGTDHGFYAVDTLGWRPTCRCDAPVIPCTILDPFAGAGTVGLVALRTGRDAILLELSAAYAAQIRARLGLIPPPLFLEAAD